MNIISQILVSRKLIKILLFYSFFIIMIMLFR